MPFAERGSFTNLTNQNNSMKNNIVIFEDKKGKVELRADIEKDTLWATQAQIAQLFQISVPNVNIHLKNIFKTHELSQNSIIKESLITAQDSKQCLTRFNNLDVIIAVGYRVNSKKATKFRIWATGILHKYLVEGGAINSRRIEQSPESLVGLHESIALLESMNQEGKLKGKLTLKLSEDLSLRKK